MHQKRMKLWIVIGIEIAIILSIGGYFLLSKNNKNKISQPWGEKYYVYLNDVIDQNKYTEAGLPEGTSQVEMSFIESAGDENPEMVLSYEKEGNMYSNLYCIDDNKVNVTEFSQPSRFILLYRIETKDTNYFLQVEDTNTNLEKYVKIENLVSNRNANLTFEYTFEKGSHEFEEFFVEMETAIQTVSLNKDSLWNQMENIVEAYQTKEEIRQENQAKIDLAAFVPEEKTEDIEEEIIVEEIVEEESAPVVQEEPVSLVAKYKFSSADRAALEGKGFLLDIYEINGSEMSFKLESVGSGEIFQGIAYMNGDSYEYSTDAYGHHETLKFKVDSLETFIDFSENEYHHYYSRFWGGAV